MIENLITKEELREKLRAISALGWIKSERHGNHGSIGNTLEDLLGIPENNLPIPNANEWELKTQRVPSSSLVTLFHMEPSPTALRFVPSLLLPSYGWPHKEAGGKYPQAEMSFRQTINALHRTDRGFGIEANIEEGKFVVSFDSSAVGENHSDWLKGVEEKVGLADLNPQPYWGFEDIKRKVAAKLTNCFFAEAEVKKIDGIDHYRYFTILQMSGFSFEGFLSCVREGKVLVDFDARTGHNHGTKFRMRKDSWPKLYAEVIDVT